MMVFCEADCFIPARLAEFESRRAVRATQPKVQKKKLIRRPKGKNWKLIDGVHLSPFSYYFAIGVGSINLTL